MLKLFSLSTLLDVILGKDGLGSLFGELVKRFGFTDLLGLAINQARSLFMAKGRSAVVAAFTIKESSVRDWAKATRANPDNAVVAFRKVAESIADAVGSLLPVVNTVRTANGVDSIEPKIDRL
jgi:hypothetical protein